MVLDAQASLRLQANLLDAVGHPMIAVDLDRVIIYWNRAAEARYGWSAEEALGRLATELIIREETPEQVKEIRDVLIRGESWSGDYEVTTRDGRRISVYVTNSPVFDEDGRLLYVIGISADATERRRLSAIVDGSGDAILGATLDGTVTSWNGAAERLFGYSAEEIIGQPAALLAPHGQASEQAAARARLDAGGPAEHVETTRCRKDGSLVDVVLTNSPTTDLDGNVVGVSVIVHDVTEQRKAQRELADSQRLLADSQRIAHLGSAEFDLVNSTMTRSAEYNRILGVSDGDEPRQDLLFSVLHPEDRPALLEAWAGATRHAVPFDVGLRIVLAESTPRWVRVRGVPVCNEQGLVVKIIGTLLDETERVEAEVALQRSERLLFAFLENLPAGVYILDADGSPFYANRAASELMGPATESAIAPGDVPVVHSLFRSGTGLPVPTDELAVVEALTGVDVHLDNTEIRRADRTIPLEVWASPVRDEAGTVTHAMAVFVDITERRQAEDRERRLSAIVESSSDAIISMSLDRTITSWNAGATALFGYTNDEAIGQKISMLAASADRDRDLTRLGAEQGMSLTNIETESLTKHGALVHVSLSISPILNRHGKPIGLSAIARDVTKRVELEAIAAESRREAVDARHATELETISREEADRANRAKSEFLSRMSHELRTPLNAVLGFGQILHMDDLSVDQRESVGFICSAGDHLLDLINDVLDISRIEAGALKLSLEAVHLNEVVSHALSLIRPQAIQNHISIPTDFDEYDHVYVRADRQRLLQVLLNLLSNAVKYNRHGGHIDLHCESSAGTVTIAVKDTGIGIAEDDLARMFTPFERLGAEGSNIEGTGVGLALARALSQQMGGSLTVSSTPGAGSTFTVELPESQLREPSAVVASPTTPGIPSPSAKPVTVLAIEDNVANVRLLERALQRCDNVTLLTAIQGRLGLELAAQHHPDLILLDLHLPDLAGEIVLGHLRADPATATIPVVICSADASPNQHRHMIERGAHAYLTKPFDLTDLFDIIEQVRGPA